MKCAAIILTPKYDNKYYSRCIQSICQVFQSNPGIFKDIIYIRVNYTENEANINKIINQGMNLACEQNCHWIFILRSDQLAAPGAFQFVSPYLEKYDAIWGQEYHYSLHPDNGLIATKREGQVEWTDNFKDILFHPSICALDMGYFIKTQSAIASLFDEKQSSCFDYKNLFNLWQVSRCIKIPEAMVYEPEIDDCEAAAFLSRDTRRDLYSKALYEYKIRQVNDLYLAGKSFEKYMDIVVYGIMRSGTTLVSDLLNVKNESIIFYEPDLLQRSYQEENAEKYQYDKFLSLLYENGLDISSLPIWNKNECPTFSQNIVQTYHMY